MTKQFRKDYKIFLKEIKKELPCSSNLRLAFMHDLKEQIKDFINDNQVTTIDDIINEFDNPKEIAKSFESHTDLSRLHKIAKKYKKLKIIFAITFTIFIAVLIMVLIIILNLNGDIIIN